MAVCTRRQNQFESAPLQISRTTKHLVLELPIGSKEGPTTSACSQKQVIRFCAQLGRKNGRPHY